jgi:hypothetical protein
VTWGIEELRFFLDRGLGAYVVPNALRSAGWRLTTMDERYGKSSSQRISDQQWIAEAAATGEILLCKDRAIATNPAEARVVYMHSARIFTLASAQVTGSDMSQILLSNQHRIVRMAARASGPYVVAVGQNGLRRLRLAYP